MDVDELIRGELLQRFPAPDAAAAWSEVERRRRRGQRARRLGAGIAIAAAAAVVGIVVTNHSTFDERDVDRVYTTDPRPAGPDYGFEPLTPLVTRPLPEVGETRIAVRHGHVLTAQSARGSLVITLSDPSRASSGSDSGDPAATPALSWFGVGPSSSDPDPRHYLVGVTRPEVERVDWVRPTGTVSVRTIENAALPQLRFFIIEDTEKTMGSPEPGGGPDGRPIVLRAYGADGSLLTDTERIEAEQDAFRDEVDRRAGVEEKDAGISAVQVSKDGQSLIVTAFTCGSELLPVWIEDASTVTIWATVKVAVGEGDCLSGETTDTRVGLEQPLAGRTVVDKRTGRQLPVSEADE